MTNTTPTELQARHPTPDRDGFYRNGYVLVGDETPCAFVPSPENDTYAFGSLHFARAAAREWKMLGFWRIKADRA